MDKELVKQMARAKERRAYWAHLDKRIPHLHKTGRFPGRLARDAADAEYRGRA